MTNNNSDLNECNLAVFIHLIMNYKKMYNMCTYACSCPLTMLLCKPSRYTSLFSRSWCKVSAIKIGKHNSKK